MPKSNHNNTPTQGLQNNYLRHPWFFPLVDPSTLGRKTLYELASLVHCYNIPPASAAAARRACGAAESHYMRHRHCTARFKRLVTNFGEEDKGEKERRRRNGKGGQHASPSYPPSGEGGGGEELNSQLGARPSSQNLPKGWLAHSRACTSQRRSFNSSWGRIHNEGETGHSI